MRNYVYPLTFDEEIEVVLQGIFLDDTMREEIRAKIADDVRAYLKKNNLTNGITDVSDAVSSVLFQKIIK
jgi:hypothetical protein